MILKLSVFRFQAKVLIEDLDFSLKVRMVTALAFMPADKLYRGFQEGSMIMPDELQDFLKYFSENKAILTLKKNISFHPFSRKVSVGECRRVSVSF